MNTYEITDIKTLDNKYVDDEEHEENQFTYDDFVKSSTIIINSSTGTGKTNAMSKFVFEFMKENPKTKWLSIVDKQSMAYQHVESFKDIYMMNYLEITGNIKEYYAYIICINSLERLNKITDDELSNYVVFIDEINSFLELTHNLTFGDSTKIIYYILKRIVNKCKKIIVADATILNNLRLFLNNRNSEMSLFVNNTRLKYTDNNAYHIKYENLFLE